MILADNLFMIQKIGKYQFLVALNNLDYYDKWNHIRSFLLVAVG
jgi:hypothetical protein